ncbi:IS4 family transposase [Herpetosiphon gulosus]|uniref:IS4 family transposase n=1 Tax=Herpetosiphon gulosus TaxID=1973496 RepID=UPI0031E6873F
MIGLPDALTRTWRGCGNATTGGRVTLKCGIQLDVRTGAITAPDLVNGRAADRALPLQQRDLPPGSLLLADRGFYHLERLPQHDQHGVFWITRLPSNTHVAYPGHAAQPLTTFVRELGPVATWDCAIIVGKEQHVHARLVVTRVAQAVAVQRRARIRQHAQHQHRMPSATALALADWNVVLTNAPRTLISPTEVWALVRVRWQIELLFKLGKSHARLDDWRTTNPARVLGEIDAKLIGLVFQHRF